MAPRVPGLFLLDQAPGQLGLVETPKFVDPEDVDFAIQDLLKDRRIGTYQ